MVLGVFWEQLQIIFDKFTMEEIIEFDQKTNLAGIL